MRAKRAVLHWADGRIAHVWLDASHDELWQIEADGRRQWFKASGDTDADGLDIWIEASRSKKPVGEFR